MCYISKIREYVGHAPIMATAASCIIYDDNKGILFEKRTDNGMWCIPGGSLELGESLEEALLREVKEETGLDIFDPVFLDVKANIHIIYPNQDEVYYTDVVYYSTEYDGDLEHDSESTELKWFKLDELPDNIMDTQIEFINSFKNKYNI